MLNNYVHIGDFSHRFSAYKFWWENEWECASRGDLRRWSETLNNVIFLTRVNIYTQGADLFYYLQLSVLGKINGFIHLYEYLAYTTQV